MEPVHFDRIARQFAGRLSRRQVLTTGGAGLAAGVLAAGIRSASAQDATPDAAAEGTSAPAMLFVQTYQSGTITPTEGVDGRYTLTLEQGHGQTIYFSDRPDRIVGADTTPRFLEGMPFPSDNPPNAALVVETAPGETDVAVVELFNPLYDPVTQGVTYEVEVLANWQAELGMEFTEAPTDLAALAPSFGSTQLFIDDCPNSDISCVSDEGGERGKTWGVISANAEMCWNYSLCQPCEPYGHTYPDYCAGYKYWLQKCNAAFDKCGGYWFCLPKWDWFQPECCSPTGGC